MVVWAQEAGRPGGRGAGAGVRRRRRAGWKAAHSVASGEDRSQGRECPHAPTQR